MNDEYDKYDDNRTLVCIECGRMAMGDSPEQYVMCSICKEILENSYPDGWTCSNCGDEYHEEMPADTSDGTICKKCFENEEVR